MAGSVNKVILIGNLGRDPEIRYTQSGKPVCNFTVATTDTWRDKQTGERREKTEWHNVVVFSEGLIRVIEQYVKKGSKVYIEGALQTRKWQDQAGNDRYTTEVVIQGFNGTLTMLDSRGGGSQGAYGGAPYQDSPYGGGPQNSYPQNDYNEAPAFGQGGGDISQSGGPSSGPPVSFEKELDDEIPF